MANIDKELNQIKNAIYGKDVRGSIHDGIDKINKETEKTTTEQESLSDQFKQLIIDAGNSNAEVVASRGKEDWLPDRLNSVDQQLAQTEDRNFFKELVNHKNPKGMFTWIDDDGNSGFYTKLKKFMEEYNIPMTSAIITDRGFGGNFMTLEQIRELEELGAEFVCHTHTHDLNNDLTTMTVPEMHHELKTSQEIIKSHGWNHRALVYPFGRHSEAVRDVVRQYFDVAIATFSDGGEHGVGHLVENPYDQFAVQRISLERDLSGIKAMLTKAADEGKWIIGMSHVDQGDWYSDERAREIIEHALSEGLKFVTVEEGLKHHGNLAQYGNTTISSDGKVYGGVEVVGVDAYSINAPITKFPINTTTQMPVRYIDSPGLNLPYQTGGIKETYRYREEAYSYEKFIPTGRKHVFYRNWNDGGFWEPWEEQQYKEYVDIPSRSDVPGYRKGRTYLDDETGLINYYDGERTEKIHRIRSGTFTSHQTAETTVIVAFDEPLAEIPSSIVCTPKGDVLGVTYSVTNITRFNFSVRCSAPQIESSYIAI